MDLFWRDTLTCPTEEDYLEMVSNSMSSHIPKQSSTTNLSVETGGLFRLAIKLMQAESSSDR